ncbi:beta-lactamase/transpeptidase-like protein [Pelagophyceae sp. CCMP2097]|nr:beta-lactamase/transpeptidase-like protein [Pelagophyceae sp. CCMP2097]
MMHSGVLAGVDYMAAAPAMFACAARLTTVKYLEWWYTSQAMLSTMETRDYSPMPDFIISGVLRVIIGELYCIDEDTGLARLVKELTDPATKKKGTLYAVEKAVQPLVGVTAVYLERDPTVVWKVSAATNVAALARGDDAGLGVAAVFAAAAPQAPAFFAAPFFTAGVQAQYHLDEADDVSLTHAELAAIYTCTIKTWAELRPDFPEVPIRLVVRTDACDTNEVFTAALSYHVPSFAEAVGTRRSLDAAQMRARGCTVVAEVTSDARVDSAVTFYQGSLGMWTETKRSTTKRARFRASANTVLALDADSLRACEADARSAVTFSSKTYGFASTVYDLSPRASAAAECWPYARSYSMVIAEALLGPAQCAPEAELSGDGPSPALELMRWIYDGATFDALEASFFDAPSIQVRARVLAVLDLYPLAYCDPPEKKAKVQSITVIIVACLCACGFFVCVVLGAMQLQKRRIARMLALAQVKLPDNVQEVIEEVWATIKDQDGGAVADYIPELAAADPTPFGIVLCDIQSSAIYETGDATQRFTLQSACKPLLYCLALEDNGMEAVDKKVGSEPTGGPFNVVSFDTQGRPFNPYVNAGAICTAGLVAGASAEERFRRTMSLFNSMSLGAAQCGTSLDVAVYDSEMATNGNNQIIVQEALKRGLIPSGQGQVALDAYTMACSLSVDCREVACVAATLANNGVNPQTGEEVMPAWVVNRTVSTMMTCGMYNGAGAWMVEVGIPAKSGVGGIIMCVVPGICGFAAFSPRLDQNGNSTRGVLVARELSNVLSLHVLHQGGDKEAKPAKKVPPATPAVKIIAVAGKAGARADDDGSSRGGRPAVSVVDSAGDVVNYSEESKGSGASMA